MNAKVIIVDSSPLFEGRELLRRIKSLKCIKEIRYVDISQIDSVIEEVNYCILGASAVLTDGSVLSRIGSALVALNCAMRNKPVYVLAEAYKFSERMFIDSLSHNENWDPQIVWDQYEGLESSASDSKSNLKVLNLAYDLVPSKTINLIFSEDGPLEPSNASSILRDFAHDIHPIGAF